MMAEHTDDWLSLNEAALLLGVAPSTMRRWGDDGRVSMRKTLGGHRRFAKADVQRLASDAPELQPLAAPRPMGGTWGVDSGEIARQDWHAKLVARPGAEQMRGLGQRLLGLLIQYINRRQEDARFIEEAHTIGAGYGAAARASGGTMHDTIEAFLYFRGNFARLANPLPGMLQPTDLADNAELRQRIEQFMDAILLGTIEGFERG